MLQQSVVLNQLNCSTGLLGDCEAPTNPNGGTYQTDPTTNSSTATISCAAGFVVNPPGSTPNITCQADGNWTTLNTPPCLRKLFFAVVILNVLIGLYNTDPAAQTLKRTPNTMRPIKTSSPIRDDARRSFYRVTEASCSGRRSFYSVTEASCSGISQLD